MLAPRVPKQRNAVDCGVFTLGFTRLIMNHFGDLRVYAGAAKDSELADENFAFLYKEVDSITTLRMRIKMLISQIANSSQASDLFAVDDDAETSDIECVEVELAKGGKEKREGSRSQVKEGRAGEIVKSKSSGSTPSLSKSPVSQSTVASVPKPSSNHSPKPSSNHSPISSSPTQQPKPSLPNPHHSNHDPSEKPTRRSSYFETHARTQSAPEPATSYKSSLMTMLQSFQRQTDPISSLKPEASLYRDAKRDRDWHVSEKTVREQKAKKRRGLDYVPQNTL